MNRLSVLPAFLFGICSVPGVGFAAQGLEPVQASYAKVKPGSELRVDHMPRVHHQGGIGICASFSAKALLEQAYCIQKGINDCTRIDGLSVLDLSRLGRDPRNTPDPSERLNFEGLNFDTGSNAARIIANLFSVGSVARESCAPYEQMVSTAADPKAAEHQNEAFWANLKRIHEQVVTKEMSVAAAASTLQSDRRLHVSQEDIGNALGEARYARFLDLLLVPDKCWDVRQQVIWKGQWDIGQWPVYAVGQARVGYDQYMATIREQLAQNRPLAFAFCAQETLSARSIRTCKPKSKFGGAGHELVLTGYRQMCDGAGKCVEALKVHNSWGEVWQRNNDDGWVLAKPLVKRSFFEEGTLTWISRRP